MGEINVVPITIERRHDFKMLEGSESVDRIKCTRKRDQTQYDQQLKITLTGKMNCFVAEHRTERSINSRIEGERDGRMKVPFNRCFRLK